LRSNPLFAALHVGNNVPNARRPRTEIVRESPNYGMSFTATVRGFGLSLPTWTHRKLGLESEKLERQKCDHWPVDDQEAKRNARRMEIYVQNIQLLLS